MRRQTLQNGFGCLERRGAMIANAKVLVLMLAMFAATGVSAQNLRVEFDNVVYKVDTVNSTATADSLINSDVKSVVFADSVELYGKLYPVETMRDSICFLNFSIESVTLPKGLKSINEFSFYGCMTLKEITLPDSLKRIEGWAFAICQELETINNISNHLDLVGECILGNTKWYEQNEETDSTGTMKVVRFSDWIVGISPLTDTPLPQELHIPQGVYGMAIPNVGAYYPEKLYIPASLKEFSFPLTFFLQLKNVIIDEGNTCFYMKDNLLMQRNKTVYIDNNTAITGNALILYTSEATQENETLVIPEETKIVGVYALSFNTSKKLVIPEGVEVLEDRCFYIMRNLTSVELPSSLSYIGKSVFSYTESLDTVVCCAPNPPKINLLAFLNYFTNGATYYKTIYVPKTSLEIYMNADIWKLYAELGLIKAIEDYDIPTDIREIAAEDKKETQGKGIYSIDGRWVGDDFEALPKGLYIVNGRKVLK